MTTDPQTQNSANGTNPLDTAPGLQGVPVSGKVYLGLGFAPRTNSKKNSVIIPNIIEDVKERIEPEFLFEYAEDYTKLASLLDVSVAASYGASGVSGGSASLRIMRSTEMVKSNAYVVFKIRIITSESTIKDAYLNDVAIEFLKKKNATAFYEKWGSHFVRTLYHGGELACVMQFSSTTNQSSDEFRSEIKSAVGALTGEADYASMVTSLMTGRSVQIKYAQSGGRTNPDIPDDNTGVIVLNPEALIRRVRSFPAEVDGSKTGKGSTVPLLADIPGIGEALNWDPGNGVNLDYPFPKEIDRIASSITILKEKLVEVLAIEHSKAVLAPSLRAAASALKPYLQSNINECSRALSEMMSDSSVKAELSIESFFQSRIRGLLGLPSSTSRENAGQSVDMSELDAATLNRMIFGVEPDLTIRPWPQVAYVGRWGFQGQYDEYGAPFNLQPRVPCPIHGGNVQSTAWEISGKTSEDDGIFAFATVHPVPIADGGHCGHHIVHFADFRIVEPDKDLLPPLPLLPINPFANVTAILAPPRELTQNRWILPFSVDLPNPTNCGSFTLIITEELKDDSSQTNEYRISSYWYRSQEQNVSLSYSLYLAEGWKVKFFTVKIDSAYSASV